MAEPADRTAARHYARPLAGFLIIGLGCAALLAVTADLTADRIQHNRAAQQARAIAWLIGRTDPPTDQRWDDNRWLLCAGVNGDATGTEAPNPEGLTLVRGTAPGYGGAIHWMLAADTSEGRLLIRRLLITAHQETPGIADFLDDPRHHWLQRLAGRGADVATLEGISGATITTRALTRNIGEALQEEAATCPP